MCFVGRVELDSQLLLQVLPRAVGDVAVQRHHDEGTPLVVGVVLSAHDGGFGAVVKVGTVELDLEEGVGEVLLQALDVDALAWLVMDE